MEEFFIILNNIAQSPPKFENKDITGVPFYSLFIDLLNTYGGQNFLKDAQVNEHLKNITNDYANMLKS